MHTYIFPLSNNYGGTGGLFTALPHMLTSIKVFKHISIQRCHRTEGYPKMPNKTLTISHSDIQYQPDDEIWKTEVSPGIWDWVDLPPVSSLVWDDYPPDSDLTYVDQGLRSAVGSALSNYEVEMTFSEGFSIAAYGYRWKCTQHRFALCIVSNYGARDYSPVKVNFYGRVIADWSTPFWSYPYGAQSTVTKLLGYDSYNFKIGEGSIPHMGGAHFTSTSAIFPVRPEDPFSPTKSAAAQLSDIVARVEVDDT